MKSRRTRDTIPEKGREGSIKSEDEIRNISSPKTSRQGVAFRSFDGVEQKGAKGGVFITPWKAAVLRANE